MMKTQIVNSYSVSKILESKVNNRNTTIDFIRLVAAFGVIAIHIRFNTSQGRYFQEYLAPFCVPFFFSTSLVYFVSNIKETSIKNILEKVWSRTITPYLAWTVIYLFLLITKSYLSGETRNLNFVKIFLYGESAVHLYFLTQLLFMQLLTLGIFLIINRNKQNIIGLILIALSFCYFTIGYLYNCFGVIKPIPLLIYIIFAFLISTSLKSKIMNVKLIIIGFLLIVATLLLLNVSKQHSIINLATELPMGGLGLLLVGIGFPYLPLPNKLIKFTSVTFGIYLSHIIFLEAIELIIEKTSIKSLNLNIAADLLILTFIFLLSSLFTLLCRKFPLYKRILLGE